MTALNNRLQKEATAKPQERVSRVWISVGYNHPKGPQDQAYALPSCTQNHQEVYIISRLCFDTTAVAVCTIRASTASCRYV